MRVVLRISGALSLAAGLAGCAQQAAPQQVVCYSSTDQVFAEPVLKAFEQETGIQVKAKYDTEETKTTGLVNLIQQEKGRPQADVFWSSETGRAITLQKAGCLAAYHSPNAQGIPSAFKDAGGFWTGFSARARVILYNRQRVKSAPPASVQDLLKPQWHEAAAIPNPLFGTSSFQAATLFLVWGNQRASTFFEQAKANGLQVLPSNGAVKDAVSEGRAAWGFVDTDDANVAIKDAKPVAVVFPDQDGLGTLVMPNTVSLLQGAPHPEAGRRLIDFLLSAATEQRLAAMDCVQMPLHPGVPTPPGVKRVGDIKATAVDYVAVAGQMRDVDQRLQRLLGL
ncbi:MAG: extracellular solute-binding protein [Armatimonadetes bacterium]|nr:extracellular solute-binding protein [Armatimonadota bacterium]